MSGVSNLSGSVPGVSIDAVQALGVEGTGGNAMQGAFDGASAGVLFVDFAY